MLREWDVCMVAGNDISTPRCAVSQIYLRYSVDTGVLFCGTIGGEHFILIKIIN